MPLAPSRVLPTGIRLNVFGYNTFNGSGHHVRFNVSSFGSPYTTFAAWFVPFSYSGRMLFGMSLYDVYFNCGGVGVNTGCADDFGFTGTFSVMSQFLAVAMPNSYPGTNTPYIWYSGVSQTLTQICSTSPCSQSVSNPVRLGCWPNNDNYELDGVIVHFFVWNRALTDSEVQQLYSCGWQNPCPPTSGLIHWIGPDGVDRVGGAPVVISNARAQWYNYYTGDGFVYAQIYSGATTDNPPPGTGYTYVASVMVPIEDAWFGYGGCADWFDSTVAYKGWMHMDRDERNNVMPNWVLRAGGPATYVSLVYNMNVYLPQSGTYTIEWISDDGFQLYIDNNLVINNWTWQAAYIHTDQVTLSSGWHNFLIKYMEGAVCWSMVVGLIMPDGTPIRPLLPMYGIKIRPGAYTTYGLSPSRILTPTR
ncbi:MAG: PA14 domain-containing protein [Thermoproteus sp.]